MAFACSLITTYAAFLIFVFSFLGGLLNRGRGGWIDLGGSSNASNHLSYWPAHLCKNLLFAVPTGVAVVSAERHGSYLTLLVVGRGQAD